MLLGAVHSGNKHALTRMVLFSSLLDAAGDLVVSVEEQGEGTEAAGSNGAPAAEQPVAA